MALSTSCIRPTTWRSPAPAIGARVCGSTGPQVDAAATRSEPDITGSALPHTTSFPLPRPRTPCSLPAQAAAEIAEGTDISVRPPSSPSISPKPHPPPFVVAELQRCSNPLPPSLIFSICANAIFTAQKLPDDGLDNQAYILQLIVRLIRTEGFVPSVCLGDASLEDLRAVLQHDATFSNAVQLLFGENTLESSESFFLILRYLCRRPTSHKPRGSVRFAPEPQIWVVEDDDDDTDGEPSVAGPPQVFPPFVVSDLLQLPNPWDSNAVAFLAVKISAWADEHFQDPDGEVQLVQFLSDVLLELDLVPFHLLSGVGVAGLRDCLHRDAALSESQRIVSRGGHTVEFVDRFFLVIRYIVFQLLR
ncbi:hypothetical protein AURDEDRAFT_188590 [Auricularia subglabra TFB-10046 SS5]|uniref:Uncharacterized protein n=1 Tax=Auricularia subglabra (strain TFB-10046 / SS5) TaxID=717982 RepID=J0CXV9_AURST|nr:hypothetical protein AURDEDRAFT_188590 [Auricularia subglabra TFB-10046 SS5]